MSFISSAPHRKYVKVVSTVIHAENLNRGCGTRPPAARRSRARSRGSRPRGSGRKSTRTRKVEAEHLLGLAGSQPSGRRQRCCGGHEGKGGDVSKPLFSIPRRDCLLTCRPHIARFRHLAGGDVLLPCPKPCAIGRPRAARTPGGGPAGRPPRARRSDARASARRRFGRIVGRRTHHTGALRPAAICCTRAAFTVAPVIILRAPKETAEIRGGRDRGARGDARAAHGHGGLRHNGGGDGDSGHRERRVYGTKSGRRTTDRPPPS